MPKGCSFEHCAQKRLLLNRYYFIPIVLLSIVTASLYSLDNGYYRYVRQDGTQVVLGVILPPRYCSEPSLESASSTFSLATLRIQSAIEEARNSSSLLVLCVPPVYSKTDQLGLEAAWREGARMALAWSSAAARFDSLGSIDLTILETQNYLEDVDQQILCKALEVIDVDVHNLRTIEDIQRRIISLDKLTIDPEGAQLNNLEPLSFSPPEKDQLVIADSFPPLQSGQKRYLITGAAGFLGSHLAELMLQQGDQIIGIDNFCCSTRDNVERLKKYPDFCFVEWDITLPFKIEATLDGVVHMASVPSPEFYYRLPKETLQTGIEGTLHCLEIARDHKARFLFTSTSEVYGDPELSPQSEDYWGNVNPIGPRSQYDQSKRGAETLISLFSQRYDLDCRIVRIFNTYGPGMILNDGRVITNFMQALLYKKPMVIHGSGNQTRSFAYYSDTINGIYSLLKNESLQPTSLLDQRVINVGSEEECSINELALMAKDVAKQILDYDAEIIHVAHIDVTDPRQRHPDLSRAKQLIGFTPSVCLRDGFIKTLDFFINQVNN